MRPGQTAQIIVQSEQLKNVLYLPRQALYIRDGQASGLCENPAKDLSRISLPSSTCRRALVVVEGLNEGTEVALVNPETAEPTASSSSGGSLSSAAKAAGK